MLCGVVPPESMRAKSVFDTRGGASDSAEVALALLSAYSPSSGRVAAYRQAGRAGRSLSLTAAPSPLLSLSEYSAQPPIKATFITSPACPIRRRQALVSIRRAVATENDIARPIREGRNRRLKLGGLDLDLPILPVRQREHLSRSSKGSEYAVPLSRTPRTQPPSPAPDHGAFLVSFVATPKAPRGWAADCLRLWPSQCEIAG